jgi:hypothetical protein
MQFNKDCKIEKCVSKDTTREALLNVQFTGHKLIATDGHVLAYIPCTETQEDTPGTIPPAIFSPARKDSKTMYTTYLRANGDVKTLQGTAMKRPDTQFPAIKAIAGFFKSAKGNKGQRFTVDITLLERAAAALGTDTLEITLPEGKIKSALLIRGRSKYGTGYVDGLAIVMPKMNAEDM